MKIGFFDSGLGGLTILREVVKVLPLYDYYFFGDTEHLPLGDKTKEEIFEFTMKGVKYLFEQDCQLVIIACNTSSADSARELQQTILVGKYADRKILGVIVPTVEEIIESSETNFALIGTKHTVESGKYAIELINREQVMRELVSIPTPELVPLIESGDYKAAVECAVKYIETKAGESEVVVLGCTHYTEIKSALRKHFVNSKRIISQDEVIPEKLKKYLAAHPEIESVLSRGGGRNIHLTKHRADYDLLLQHFLSGGGA